MKRFAIQAAVVLVAAGAATRLASAQEPGRPVQFNHKEESKEAQGGTLGASQEGNCGRQDCLRLPTALSLVALCFDWRGPQPSCRPAAIGAD